MIRVALFLILIVALALGAVWLADRPGDVAITWQGVRIETSVMVAAVGLATLVAVAIAVWSLLRGLWRAPKRASTALAERRRRRGFNAISRGLVAIGAGDAHFQLKARARTQEFVSRAKIMLMASHAVDFSRAMCNKALLLDHGRRLFFGDIEEGLSRYAELR